MLALGIVPLLSGALTHSEESIRYEAVGLIYWLAQDRILPLVLCFHGRVLTLHLCGSIAARSKAELTAANTAAALAQVSATARDAAVVKMAGFASRSLQPTGSLILNRCLFLVVC